jgi:hypothetical protein
MGTISGLALARDKHTHSRFFIANISYTSEQFFILIFYLYAYFRSILSIFSELFSTQMAFMYPDSVIGTEASG